MILRPVELSDASAWEAMRRALWPEGAEDHAREILAFFAGTRDEPQAVLVLQEGSSLVAFAEVSIRDDIHELAGKRVGYVEGLYVVPLFAVVEQRASCFPLRANGLDKITARRARVIVLTESSSIRTFEVLRISSASS